jgi:hypothetical protein
MRGTLLLPSTADFPLPFEGCRTVLTIEDEFSRTWPFRFRSLVAGFEAAVSGGVCLPEQLATGVDGAAVAEDDRVAEDVDVAVDDDVAAALSTVLWTRTAMGMSNRGTSAAA